MPLTSIFRSVLTRRCVVAVLILVLSLTAAPAAHAAWWKIVLGIASTVGGVGLGVSGNVPTGVALIGLQGTLLSSVAVDEGSGATGDGARPGFLDLPAPVTTEPAREALIREYPEVQLSGDAEVDRFLLATNEVFARINDVVFAYRSGAGPEELAGYQRAYAFALQEAASEYRGLGVGYRLTQDDVDAFQRTSAKEGLPAAEREFLERLGFNADEVAAFTDLVATAPVHLTRPVTPDEILDAGAQSILSR